MAYRPSVFVFDVLGTLLSPDALALRLEKVGVPADAVELWTTRILRDGFALAATGTFHPFHEVAARALGPVLEYHGVTADVPTVEEVMHGFDDLVPQEDAAPALERLSDAGLRVVALTNVEAATVRRALKRADLQDHFQQIFDIEEIGAWKPLPETYGHVAETLGVPRDRLALVASHTWDVHGAKRAGLSAGFVDRRGAGYPSSLAHPDVIGADLLAVIDGLLDLPYPHRRERPRGGPPAPA